MNRSVARDDRGFLVVQGLEKRFGGVHALRGVDIDIRAGEVHGLVGANGAGKSTLIRILAGVEAPDRGAIRIDGEPVEIGSPHRATDLGLSFIHQELNLVPQLSALQNIMLGARKPSRLGLLDWSRIRAEVAPVAASVGIDFEIDVKVATLTTAQRWLVSICRALVRRARLIVMDEPTASLSAHEADNLFRIVRNLRADGIAVLYVSHRLDEVLDLCDRVTAFRDGSLVMQESKAGLTRRRLIEAIVGGAEAQAIAPVPASFVGEPILQATGLVRLPAVRGVDFTLHRGEVLGFAGLVGAGRTELIRLVYGADRLRAGSMVLKGRPFAPRSPRHAVAAGIGLVPEERRSEGLILSQSVTFNLALPSNGRFTMKPLPFLGMKKRTAWARALAGRMTVKTPSVDTPVQRLSGGNQQKVVIGRWVDRALDILVLDEPSRGVDIGARGEIHRMIRALAAAGLAVIVVSSESEELPGLCDRVLVMAEGRIVETLRGTAITREAIVRASYQHFHDDTSHDDTSHDERAPA